MPTASVEDAICVKLKATGLVQAIVGTRVYPQLTTQEPTFPQVVYSKIGTETGAKLKSGTSDLKAHTIRVDCYAETEAGALTLGKAVRDLLTPEATPWRDLTVGVHGCFHADSAQDYTEDGLRFQSEIFTVWFKPVA